MKRFLDWRLLTALLVFVFGMVVTSCGGNHDGGVAVDLGLPSGTLWADRNIGADSPEDCGDYFAWGETEPKTTYDWSTYKWCNGSDGTIDTTLTKYCYRCSHYKTTLEPEDDAATANWGKSWYMPTKTQIKELKNECTWTWTTQNDVKGYKVTGPNGNSIFLPASGCREDSGTIYYGDGNYAGKIHGVGMYACYWSSSLYNDPSDAWYLTFHSQSFHRDRNERYEGLAVRAVCVANN